MNIPVGCPVLQRGWLTSAWQGLRLLAAAVPRSKWREAIEDDEYLEAKQHEFGKVPILSLKAVRH